MYKNPDFLYHALIFLFPFGYKFIKKLIFEKYSPSKHRKDFLWDSSREIRSPFRNFNLSISIKIFYKLQRAIFHSAYETIWSSNISLYLILSNIHQFCLKNRLLQPKNTFKLIHCLFHKIVFGVSDVYIFSKYWCDF